MDAERWQRLKHYLADLADLPSLERFDAAKKLPLEADDRVWLDKLLLQLDGTEALFPQPAQPTAAGFASALRWQIGDHLGSYVIDGFLGRGGMGEVYAAHGAADRAPVALKILRQGLEQSSFAHFSANEQRALQRLDDSRIARFIDTFNLPDVGVCLVLERVDGEILSHWCENRQLSIDARLAIFVEICHAVASAHQQLVVHRDLKPGNVMVTANGQIKLLDFGVAKLLDDDTTANQTYGGVYTLEFAAPEQILRDPVSTATDIYALGVMLFQLLTNASPYQVSAQESLVKAVLADPPRSLNSARAAGVTFAFDRDLDRVIARAMEKVPRERYRSALEMAAEVQSIRDGAPINAGGSRWYRVQKFVRRYPSLVAMSTLLLLTLLISTGVSLHWAQRAGDQAQLAATESERARAVSEFLVGLFQVSDPGVNRGDRLTANQILDRGATELATKFSDQPLQRANLQMVTGNVYVAMGEYARARAVVESALVGLQKDPTQTLETARALRVLAQIATQQQTFSEAIALVSKAESMLGRLGIEAFDERARLALIRSRSNSNLGDFQAANAALASARDLAGRIVGGNAELTANLHANAADLADDSGNYELAKVEYGLALKQMSQVLGDDHYRTVAIRTNFAGMLVTKFDDFDTAQPLLEKALTQWQRLRGSDSAAYASTANTLGELFRHRGNYERAALLFADSERAYRATNDGKNPAVIWPIMNLGNSLDDQGEFQQALEQYERALKIAQGLPDSEMDLASIRLTTASTLIALGRYELALELANQSLSYTRVHNPPDHPMVVNALKWIGFAHFALGDKAKATVAWTEALERAPRAFAHLPRAVVKMREAIADPQAVLAEFARRALHKQLATGG